MVDQFNGQVTNKIAFIQNNHRIDNVQDAESYIQRLHGIKTLFVEFGKKLADRAAFAVITPEFSFPGMIKDIGNLKTTDPKSHILYLDFSEKLDPLEIGQVEKATLKK